MLLENLTVYRHKGVGLWKTKNKRKEKTKYLLVYLFPCIASHVFDRICTIERIKNDLPDGKHSKVSL